MKKLKKLWIVPGLLLIACLALAAWDVPGRVEAFHLIQVTNSSGEPTSEAIDDDFNTSDGLDGWTAVDGTWSEATGALGSSTQSEGISIIYTDRDLDSKSFYAEMKIDTNTNRNYVDFHFYVVGSGSTDDLCAVSYKKADDDQGFTLYTADGGNEGTWTVIGSPDTSVVDDDDYVGYKITGPANNATINIYDNGTSSNWENRAAWSSPIATWTGVDLSGVTNGDYVGVGGYRPDSDVFYVDDFKCIEQ